MAPLLRKLDAPGVRPNSAALIDGLMEAARTLEFGLGRLHPSPGDRDAFRRYRRSVTRYNTLFEQFTVAQGQATPKPPTVAAIDTADDSAILQQADGVALGARGCTFPSTMLVMRRRPRG